MFAALAALAFYALLASAFLFRLFPVWSTYIPGGLQDTRFLLWNDWWFRYAIDTLHTNPFHTAYLYHPFGTSLVLSDYPLWNSLVTYFAQHWGANLIASANLSFILSWILMGFATYLLALEVTKHRAPAVVAGLYVMTHSFTLVCTMQNWTRFNLYGIPLFLWSLVRARRSGRVTDYIISGVALAWTAACHYYFFVYCLLIWGAIFIADYFPFGYRVAWQTVQGRSAWRRSCLVLSGLAGSVAFWIHFGHPADLDFGATHIGLETPYNALLVTWFGLYLWLLGGLKAQQYSRVADVAKSAGQWRKHVQLLGTTLVCLSPLVISVVKMVLHGDYPHQSTYWKTECPGANLFSFFMPNPMHALWGSPIWRWFTSRGMTVQEQVASLGWVFLALVALGRPWRLGRSAKRWVALAVGSTLLAMGPYLHIAQHDLWMPLPFYFLRLLPVVGKARLADHWMTVGSVAAAVVAAFAITRLSQQKKWSLTKLSALAGALILLENWPAIPFAPVSAPKPIFERLRIEPPGAVLLVPLFVGDAMIGVGDSRPSPLSFPWDYLWDQTAHQKPILGGYMGRMSRKIMKAYQADPFMKTLLDLEENTIPNSPAMPVEGKRAIENFSFRYVILYPGSAGPEVANYVLKSLPLEEIAKDDSIHLYQVRRL